MHLNPSIISIFFRGGAAAPPYRGILEAAREIRTIPEMTVN
jgi:hypothetical protein